MKILAIQKDRTMQVTDATAPVIRSPHNKALRALSEKLEAQFLAEMLKASGVGKPRETLGGGAGEDHFSSFLTQEYAQAIVQRGGIGLSESIYRSLVKAEDMQ